MKKYLAWFLALVMLLGITACGSSGGSGASKKTELEDVKSLEFEVAEKDTEPEGFICVVDRGDKYYWQIGVDTYEELYEIFDLTADPSTYVNIYVAAENEEKYPYLYPEEGWKGYVTADSLSPWFDDEFQDGAVAAFNEWRSAVYSKFDYETIRAATPDAYIEAAPGEDYEVTQDDIDMFMAYTKNSLNRDTVYELCVQELGSSVATDAYQYLKTKVADKLKNKADVGTLLKNMGITNTGGTQENFGGGVIATYFDFDSDTWRELDGGIAVVKQFLAKGMTYSNASDNMNRLHSYRDGRILYEASNNAISTNNAFAVVAGKDGTLSWRAGIDNCEAIRTVFDLSGSDYLDLQVEPILDQAKAEYSLPDGLNPEVTRYYAYFEDSAVTWTLETRDGAEFPDWFTADLQNEAMAAFEEWKSEVYSHFDRDAAVALFPLEYRDQEITTYTDKDVLLLKEYVTVLRDLEAQGTTMGNVLRESVSAVCGSTLWGEMSEWAGSKWRLVHTDCPQPCMKIGYCAYKGLVSYNEPGQSIDDSFVSAVSGYAFTDIDWGYGDGSYPFQAAVDLMKKGLIVFTDHENWYLAAGEDCTVLLEISEADLMAK